MKFIFTILIVSALAYLVFAYIGSIKYQVKFYTRKYSQLLRSGLTEEDAINRLVSFYLRAEPEWKLHYMNSRFEEYVQDFDQLVYDIALFYYKVDPEQKTWGVDRFSRPVPVDRIIHYADKYLLNYKQKYFDM